MALSALIPAAGSEHFCTVFDRYFLPQGLALYESLARQARPFVLWVFCGDDQTESALKRLALPGLTPLPLAAAESAGHRRVREQRSRREYCWTLTPALFEAVFDLDPTAPRVTYLDADLYFFADPRALLRDMGTDHSALLTEAAFPPSCAADVQRLGRFCVQFVCVRRDAAGLDALRWWRDRCIEWCAQRHEPGRYGDQLYLDQWPARLGPRLAVVADRHRTLAPWNVRHFAAEGPGPLDPVFYHFQSLRLLPGGRVKLHNRCYAVGSKAGDLYDRYLEALSRAMALVSAAGAMVPIEEVQHGWWHCLRHRVRAALGFGAEGIGRLRHAPPGASRVTG